jgi:hypothetical protein
VVVAWADDCEDPLPFRSDAWSHNLLRTLPANAAEMSTPGSVSPANIGDLKRAGEFEISNNAACPLGLRSGTTVL